VSTEAEAEAEAEETPEETDAEEEKLKRAAARKGFRALEGLRAVLETLGSTAEEITELTQVLEDRIEALKPPDRRKCKEYKRAVNRAKKGTIGIDPEEVVLYCSCRECREIREKQGLPFRGMEGDGTEPAEDTANTPS
jgi:hypothetical protein